MLSQWVSDIKPGIPEEANRGMRILANQVSGQGRYSRGPSTPSFQCGTGGKSEYITAIHRLAFAEFADIYCTNTLLF